METQVNRGTGLGVSIVGAYGEGGAQKAGFTGGSGGNLINLLTNNITSLGGLFIGGEAGKTVRPKCWRSNSICWKCKCSHHRNSEQFKHQCFSNSSNISPR